MSAVCGCRSWRRPRRSRHACAAASSGSAFLHSPPPNALPDDWIAAVRGLLEAPSSAVLTTYRKDGSALVSPVWYRWTGAAFEVVIARDDPKVRHLERDPRCVLVVFEAVRPFRG